MKFRPIIISFRCVQCGKMIMVRFNEPETQSKICWQCGHGYTIEVNEAMNVVVTDMLSNKRVKYNRDWVKF